jgi:nicotinate-nucleotide pyrophosphorylase (carboxylating)
VFEDYSTLNLLLDLAFREDLGHDDVTTRAVVPATARASAKLVAKQPLVVFGLKVFTRTLQHLDETVWFEPQIEDGQPAAAGTVVGVAQGPARAILSGERVALNLLMRLSGIATLTRAMKTALKDHPRVKLLDTRKTTPGLRTLEKAAVRAGGGTNHRTGLFDGVLIKDNHIVVAGSIAEAVGRARAQAHHLLRIQCEVVDLAGVKEAVDAGADAILLDNMNDGAMGEAVKMIRAAGRPIFIEASGNMTVPRLPKVAALGVDGISVGALTHGATAVDYSLEFQPIPA